MSYLVNTILQMLLQCPIPPEISYKIFMLYLGFGTFITTQLKHVFKANENEYNKPINVIMFGTLDRCRYIKYYMNKTNTIYYDNSSYFSRQTLFEIHINYLKNKNPNQHPYLISTIHDLSFTSQVMCKERLLKFIREEPIKLK